MKLFILGLFLFIPTVVFSAAGDFVALTPIPGLNTGSGTTLVEYVNGIFTLVISLAAMLAVLRIVTGGFKYMTSEAVGEKGEARETIQGAVFGLVLLLGSWLILTTINPQILDLSTLRFGSLNPGETAQTAIDQIAKDRAEYEARAQEFASGNQAIRLGREGNVRNTIGGLIPEKGLTSFDKNIFKKSCTQQSKSNGVGTRTYREVSRTKCENKETHEIEYTLGTLDCNSTTQRAAGIEFVLICTDD